MLHSLSSDRLIGIGVCRDPSLLLLVHGFLLRMAPGVHRVYRVSVCDRGPRLAASLFTSMTDLVVQKKKKVSLLRLCVVLSVIVISVVIVILFVVVVMNVTPESPSFSPIIYLRWPWTRIGSRGRIPCVGRPESLYT